MSFLKEPQRAHKVGFEKWILIVVPAEPKAALPLPLQGGVNHGIDAANQESCRLVVAEIARQPIDMLIYFLEAGAVAFRPMPTAQVMARANQMVNQVTAQKAGGSGDCDPHSFTPGLNYRQE